MRRENPFGSSPFGSTALGSSFVVAAVLLLSSGAAATAAEAPPTPQDELSAYLADRGRGVGVSMFGTFVEPGEWLVYPFYEYTRTPKYEYHASELGGVGDQDYFGKLVEQEYLLFVAYGISDRLALELEGAIYAKASFDKAPEDTSSLPSRLEESGLGDVEGQVRWLWAKETGRRPELYSFLEIVLPLQDDERLIGTQDWEGALGFGIRRGYRWGTVSARLAAAWDGEDQRLQVGEYALEYIKRISPRWRFVAILEGESSEISAILEAQWFVSPHAFVKLNCGFGLAEQSPDVAPEFGVMFHW